MQWETTPLVEVEVLTRVHSHGGGAVNAGERAGFTAAAAADLVARGIARYVEKAPDTAPSDRMQKAAPVKKGV